MEVLPLIIERDDAIAAKNYALDEVWRLQNRVKELEQQLNEYKEREKVAHKVIEELRKENDKGVHSI